MPWKRTIEVNEVVDLLNEILELDPEAVNALFRVRSSCNKALAEHETVQVLGMGEGEKAFYAVGFLGILGGMFGKDERGWSHICMVRDDETGRIQKFSVVGAADGA